MKGQVLELGGHVIWVCKNRSDCYVEFFNEGASLEYCVACYEEGEEIPDVIKPAEASNVERWYSDKDRAEHMLKYGWKRKYLEPKKKRKL
jgi:hypothetical protein